jgi:hypothetical protein
MEATERKKKISAPLGKNEKFSNMGVTHPPLGTFLAEYQRHVA